MTKLFNKCPFNGDERCSCKKCQCVRRNRESAKLSQEKKRNAVEQLDTYKRRITELEESERTKDRRIGEWDQKYKKLAKRNVQLEEEVLMLKSLLKEMKANPNIKQHMMQTIEPVSKILNND
jgi:thymidylate synthase